jgi:hypothetical protein
MRKLFTRRGSLVLVGVLLLLAAAPIAVLAATGTFNGALEPNRRDGPPLL